MKRFIESEVQVLQKLHGKKTYTTIATTAALLVVAWLQGFEPKTLVTLGLLGLLGGVGSLRHAVARGSVSREVLVSEIVSALAKPTEDSDDEAAR
tara:strand:- start:416 stop:700 length:285 start_codon:yes stop_codon:yes gene_type:complete